MTNQLNKPSPSQEKLADVADELNNQAAVHKIEAESNGEYEEVLTDENGRRYFVEHDADGESIRTYLPEGQTPPKKKPVL